MRQTQHEIMVLKPTAVFLSFLASQLPNTKLPDLKLLQIDNTAYILKQQNSDDATLAQIENHFSSMFHHEICRWLGDSAHSTIESNFLDFLCCFKFELHNHIMLMESSIENSHQMLLIKPRTPLLNWFKTTITEENNLLTLVEQVELVNLVENATVLVKNFTNLTEIKPFIHAHYQQIFTTAMRRFPINSEQWPGLNSFYEFSHYFACEIHTQLIHLPNSGS